MHPLANEPAGTIEVPGGDTTDAPVHRSVLAYETRDHALVLSPGDRIDSPTVGAIEERVAAEARAGRRRIVIDLVGVHRVETDALSEMCGLLHRISDGDMHVAVVGADDRVRWTLESCGISGLELHPTIGAAVTRQSLVTRLRATVMRGV